MACRIVVTVALAISLTSCKSGEKSLSDSDQNSDTSSTSALSNGTATMADFDGEATTAELQVMLDNSELSCSSGDILSFDGENWSCSSTFTNFQSTGITDDATSEAVTIDENGNVGIGSSTQSVFGSKLLIYSDLPRLTIQDDDEAASYLQLKSYDANSGVVTQESAAGNSTLSLQARPNDGTSNATVRFFRETSTSGLKRVQFMKGDNTVTVDAQIGVDGTDTYFRGGGNFGIGTTSPQRKLHVSDAMRLEPLTSPPSVPAASAGDMYYDDSNALCVFTGSWEKVAGPGTCG